MSLLLITNTPPNFETKMSFNDYLINYFVENHQKKLITTYEWERVL